MPPRRDHPLFIECQNPACGRIKQVKTLYYQRKQKYCSHRCSSTVLHRAVLPVEARRRGGQQRAHRAKVRIRERVETLPPLEAFRYGYMLGLKSKHRQMKRRREQVVPGKAAA